MPTPRFLRFLLPVTALATLLVACGGDSTPSSSSGEGVKIVANGKLPEATVTDRGLDLPPTPTPTLAPPSTATPLPPPPPPTATPPPPSAVPLAAAPTPTPQPPAPVQSQAVAPPAAAAPAPAGPITFKPETLQQGGMAIVYLNA